MLSRFVRYQLVAFLIITVIGITYASVVYASIPRLLGIGRYSVMLELPDSGGIYENAIVTYRGKDVGKVEKVDLQPGNVLVTMSVNDDVEVPRDLTAEVRNTSAVGEQYVNFVPRSAGGPYLADGDVIPIDRATIPTDVATLLGSVNQLVSTIPTDKLNTVLDESYAAFQGTGVPLQRLLDSLGKVTDAANANYGPTVKLFQDLQPVLATQQRARADIAVLTRNLASFTDQTRASDGDIRELVDVGTPFADEVRRLFSDLRPTLPMLLSNLTDVGQVTTAYLDNLRMTLIVFPIATQQVTQINYGYSSPSPNYAALNFKLSVNNPPPCTKGFETTRRDPNDTSVVSANAELYCKEPKDSPIGVRMARNHPCPPGSPKFGQRSNDARGCGLSFQSRDEELAQRAENIAIQDCVKRNSPQHVGDPFIEAKPGEPCYLGDSIPPSRQDEGDDWWKEPRTKAPPAPADNAEYMPRTGTALDPNGVPFVVGNAVAPVVTGPQGLAGFLLTPLQKAP